MYTQFQKLKTLLLAPFQLDQPGLDFSRLGEEDLHRLMLDTEGP